MAMNPRTHPRGAPPDFSMEGLPPNPRPKRVTNALWWLIQMRLRLEPLSESGGDFANKKGYHNAGENLEDHGLGDLRTDHSIRRAPDREGPWWKDFSAAHDWTFTRAHSGNHTEINKYMQRRINAMRSLTDLRPDDVYAYTIGQLDGDDHIEGWNEYKDAEETGDDTHDWHIHDSFRRNIIGLFPAMWKVLTIDMGWTYEEWLRSVTPPQKEDLPVKQAEFNALFLGAMKDKAIREQVGKAVLEANVGGTAVPRRNLGQAVGDLANGLRAALWFPPGHKESVEAKVLPGSPIAGMIEKALEKPPTDTPA